MSTTTRRQVIPSDSASDQSLASQNLVDGDAETAEYFCPVCGITLSRADFTRREADYYCPHCSTRQTPALL